MTLRAIIHDITRPRGTVTVPTAELHRLQALEDSGETPVVCAEARGMREERERCEKLAQHFLRGLREWIAEDGAYMRPMEVRRQWGELIAAIGQSSVSAESLRGEHRLQEAAQTGIDAETRAKAAGMRMECEAVVAWLRKESAAHRLERTGDGPIIESLATLVSRGEHRRGEGVRDGE